MEVLYNIKERKTLELDTYAPLEIDLRVADTIWGRRHCTRSKRGSSRVFVSMCQTILVRIN